MLFIHRGIDEVCRGRVKLNVGTIYIAGVQHWPMDQRLIQEISEAVARELRDKERASVRLEIDGRPVKGVGISTGFLTPLEAAKMLGPGGHPDPFYAPWAQALSRYAARHLCGPAVEGVVLTRDRAPICDFEDIPTDGCEFSCGPILVMNTDIGAVPAPPCHGADKPGCAGSVLSPDLCTMVKAAGCRSPYEFERAFYYSVSLLDFSNRAYQINEVKLQVDDQPLAVYSFGFTPERKAREEILYLYMVIAFPFDFTGVEPPPGAE
jgi:hypothetical protein